MLTLGQVSCYKGEKSPAEIASRINKAIQG